jgi:CheY-like chemotaxis protein
VVEFRVEDTGIGILPEDMQRIFEPFERGSQPAIAPSQGTGLGLTISKLLTEIMGGEIALTSTPGVGTCARVKLFLSRVAQPRAAAPGEARITGYQGARRTVIVTDDDPAHRDLMQDVLAPLGFILFTAPDGQSCLTLAAECDPDLILLDIVMPGLNGWEVAERLREGVAARAAILMLSANVGDIGHPRTGGDCHDGMIAKPVDISQMLDRIRATLGLEWDFSPQDMIEAVAPMALGALPSPERLAELMKFGRIGHVKAIERILAEIEDADPAVAGFTRRLRALVRDFDLRRYMSALQEVAGHDA